MDSLPLSHNPVGRTVLTKVVAAVRTHLVSHLSRNRFVLRYRPSQPEPEAIEQLLPPLVLPQLVKIEDAPLALWSLYLRSTVSLWIVKSKRLETGAHFLRGNALF
jgi:hypothetical protein